MIKAYYKQGQQIMEIEDNGPGFSNFDNVLTPFYTTKSGGSGIGLSLCSEIIKNHLGQLRVENIHQQENVTGAKVSMQWPLNVET